MDNSYNDVIVNNDSSLRSLKIVLVICIVIFCVVLFFVLFLVFGDMNKSNRTVMIYMVGSDLESKNGFASLDLEDITPKNINFEENNIVLMVGGSTKWHNYVDKDEVAIYNLTESGFVKEKVYELSSMGNADNLVNLLEYSYDNYKAHNYDLIFWNHGVGAYATQNDEIYGDYLTISELETALKESPFGADNKIESVLFINCLTGNLHFAQVMSNYANYMIGSEELSYVGKTLDKLDFLEKIDKDDTGADFGIKFIDHLAESVNAYNDKYYKKLDSTYSVIDLSEIPTVTSKLNELISSIDISANYKKLSKLRGNMVTYGKENQNFDMVDLYALVYGLKGIVSDDDVTSLLYSIKSSVVYNWSLNSYSYGLSIYFPYHGTASVVKLHLDELQRISSDEYLSFITDFNDIKNLGSNTWSFDKNLSLAVSSEFSLLLTDEQILDFSRASVIVFKDMKDGYYMPMYTSSDTVLNSNGVLSFKYHGKALKVIDKQDGSEENIYLMEKKKTEDYTLYMTYALLQNSQGENVTAEVYIIVDDEHPNGFISHVIRSDGELPSMGLLELEDYDDMFFSNFKYKVFDEFGKYMNDWQGDKTAYLFRTGTLESSYQFEISDLEDVDDYYCLFKIYDVNNDVHYSELIPIG